MDGSKEDELTTTVLDAVKKLTQVKKAEVLLNTALALIEDRQYGEKIENYLDVYLKTPGLPKEDMVRALLARSNARTISGEGLLARARQDIRQRLPTEIWDEIASHMPRYHLRTWLFVSHLHRGIASRRVFHTITMAFGDCDHCERALSILDHAKNVPVFASHVKSLRLLWFLGGVNMLNLSNLMINQIKSILPAFKALRNLEWIGYPEMQAEMVQALHNTPKHLHGVGLTIREKMSIACVSAFEKLRKFGLGVYGPADVKLLRTVLDQNEFTLKHLALNGSYDWNDWTCPSLNLAFESVTIKNLIHLEVHIQISHDMLTQIVSAHNLRSLILRKACCVDLDSAATLFASDRIIDGSHTLLPHLAAFRFILDDKEHALYHSVIHFLRQREKLRRLDLGSCPWKIIKDILPDLRNLRVFAIHGLSQNMVRSLLVLIPRQMVALKLSVDFSDGTFDQYADRYADHFTRFNTLSFLHLWSPPPKRKRKNDFRVEKPNSVIPTAVPSLDFLAWNDRYYVIMRSYDDKKCKDTVQVKRLSSKVEVSDEDAAWLEYKL